MASLDALTTGCVLHAGTEAHLIDMPICRLNFITHTSNGSLCMLFLCNGLPAYIYIYSMWRFQIPSFVYTYKTTHALPQLGLMVQKCTVPLTLQLCSQGLYTDICVHVEEETELVVLLLCVFVSLACLANRGKCHSQTLYNN